MPELTRRTFLMAAGSLLAGRQKPAELERSYWLHASLGLATQRGYWGWDFPKTPVATHAEVRNAARLLCGRGGANRLYLLYHHELPVPEALRLFRDWREACPRGVEVVPTVLLRMYDKAAAPVFEEAELRALCAGLREHVNRRRLGVYDIYPKRDQGKGLEVLSAAFPSSLIRVGLQPGEALEERYAAGVEDTWSGLCHGKSNADWQEPGFGAETLGKWVEERNTAARRIAWDLVTVAWDYSVTRRGEYPGYDDAERNMPLPAGRNRLAAELIRRRARPENLAGFSSDLFILHVNSASRNHDGPEGSFYETLKRGVPYAGYYAEPLNEIAGLYSELRG